MSNGIERFPTSSDTICFQLPATCGIRRQQLPGLLWLFGEEGLAYLPREMFPKEDEFRRLQRLFPEATVIELN